jgi:tetratricopeptide (TPR) repeat protein
MAIKGSLTEAALADVIQLLAYSGKSGCLSVTDAQNFGNIFIKEGKVVYATIINKEQRLGDVLIQKKIIEQSALQQALLRQKSDKKKRIGEILIEMGAIGREILEKELKNQIEQVIFTMLTWESGFFNFEADLLPSKEEYTVRLSAQELLLEGARRIDEWKKIEKKVPPFETILVRKGDIGDVSLTEEEKKILDLIDGSRTIDDVIKLSEYDFFVTNRAIYGLMSAGLLEKPERPAAPQKPTGDIFEYKNLGFAFYKTEMYDEAEREYNKALAIKAEDAEALFYLGLIAVAHNDYEAAREHLRKAAYLEKRTSILVNLGYVCIKLNHFDEAIEYLRTAHDCAPESTKVQCALGKAYYEKGELTKAATMFEEIVKMSPETMTPYIYLPHIYVQHNDIEHAAEVLSRATDIFPRMPLFKNNLAVLYETLGKPEEAEKLYRQAIDADPRDKKIARNLADFYYGAEILGAAKELYEKIPEDDRDWQVCFNLGTIYLRQGNSERALELWNRAKKLNPSEETITYNIDVLRRSGGE